MSLLSLSRAGIAPAHTSLPLLESVDLVVGRGERLALIGPNGSGKSTLLAALAGEIDLLTGVRFQHEDARVAHARRDAGEPIASIESVLLEHRRADQEALASLRLAQADLAGDGLALATAIDSWDERGGWQLEARMARVLDGLGTALRGVPLDRPVAKLSGGQRQRVHLAALLIADADVVLLDEPTDDLDAEATVWLERELLASDRALVIASHDRTLLERWPSRVASIDQHAKRLIFGAGPLGVFEAAHQQRKIGAERDYEAYERRRAAAQRAADARAAQSVTMTRVDLNDGRHTKQEKAWYNERAGGLARSARVLRERDERERVDRPHRPHHVKPLHVASTERDRGGGLVLHVDNAHIGYAPARAIAGPLTLSVARGERLALTGRNGAGKTTLLRTIAGSLEPLAGAIRAGSSAIAVLEQDVPSDVFDQTALEIIASRLAEPRRPDAALVLGALLVRGSDMQRPVAELSAGSRRKVLLACLIASGADLLLLDEPANHLDLPSRDALAAALESAPSALVFTSHDRALLERIATREFAVG